MRTTEHTLLTIPGYQIVEHVHTGAVSHIYRARRTSDDRPVVLKVCPLDPTLPERMAWFQREYNLIHSLNLDGVVRAYALEITQQHAVMVLEDTGGEALSRLAVAGTLSLIDFLKLALQITTTLAQLHQRQIIHKHINPTNILYNPASGQVTLIDFGLATTLSHEPPIPCPATLVQGTLPYLSPEQTGRVPRMLDYRTDLYALGVTLYELLAGRVPFDSEDADALIECHLSQEPAPLHEQKPGIPPIFSDIILKLMAKEADHRYQSAASLKADLEECLQQLITRYYIEPFVPGQRTTRAETAIETAAKSSANQERLTTELAQTRRMLEEETTRRQQAEKALQASQGLFQSFVDHAPAAIFVKNCEGRYILANERAGLALNCAGVDLIGKHAAELLPPDVVAEIDHYEQEVINAGQPMVCEQQVPLADGMHTYLVTRFPLYDEQGKVYAIGGIASDITERKQAEETLQLAQFSLDHSADEILWISEDKHFLYANNAACRHLGYTRDELLTMTIADINPVFPMERWDIHWQNIQQQGYIKLETSHRRKDGTIFPVEVTSTHLEYDNKAYICSFIRDITERKQAEAQLLDQHEALTMLRERERLARELHDNMGQVLGYIKTQAQATRELINRDELLLADSYLTQMIAASQEHQTDIREFILGATVRGTLEQGFFATLDHYLQRYERLYGITVSLEVAPELTDQAFAPATDAQLMRIIQEALTNSRKHAQAQAARVICTSTAEQVHIIVADDGCGFDPRQAHHLIEDSQHFGLHSMRERAAEIGAHLHIETRPGAGTQVIIQLPRHVPLKCLPQRQRVLLVDDHPLFLQGMQNLLVGRGVDVVGTASDGMAALSQARALLPDLILMDVDMPACNGLEATRLIKAELPDIPIVMLTMSEDDSHLFEAIKGGAAGYLLKGLDTDQFFMLLTSVLEGETVISPGLASRVLAEFAHQDRACGQESAVRARAATAPTPDTAHEPSDYAAPPVELTERQVEVLTMVAQGYTYPEIGELLHLSKHTIRYHMREIISQLHFKNRAEIIAFVQQQGLMKEA